MRKLINKGKNIIIIETGYFLGIALGFKKIKSQLNIYIFLPFLLISIELNK